MLISEYIKSVRKRLKLTQADFSDELSQYDNTLFDKLDSVTVSRWERSITRPSSERILGIIAYFRQYDDKLLPFYEDLGHDQLEETFDKEILKKIFSANKRQIIDFPLHALDLSKLQIIDLSGSERSSELLNLPFKIHKSMTENYFRLLFDQIVSWAEYPGSFAHVAEVEGHPVGALVGMRLKPEVFDALIRFERPINSLLIEDFAEIGEDASFYFFGFYAYTNIAAVKLFAHFYAYLIRNQNNIYEMGNISVHEIPKNFMVKLGMDLTPYPSQDEGKFSHRGTLKEVLLNKDILELFLG